MCAIVLLFQGVWRSARFKTKKEKNERKKKEIMFLSYQVLSKVPQVLKTPVSLFFYFLFCVWCLLEQNWQSK